jgi:hypothetical protein
MILGIMGQAGSGKDVFADHLVEKYGYVRIALADPIKRMAMELYDMTEEQLWGVRKEQPDLRYPIPGKGFMTPRVACQIIGTEVIRNLYPDTWVDLFSRHAHAVLSGSYSYSRTKGLRPTSSLRRLVGSQPHGVVCPDVRFKNEVSGLHKMAAKVVRLKRNGRNGHVGIVGHSSEEEQKTITDMELDGILQVREGLDYYRQDIDKFMKRYNGNNILRLAP